MLLWDSQPRKRVVLTQHRETEANWRVIDCRPVVRPATTKRGGTGGTGGGSQWDSYWQPKKGNSYCHFSNPYRKPKTRYREILTHTGCAKRERERRGWYQKEKGLGKIQIRSQKEVVDMGRLFAQKYFELYSNFNDIVNYTLSSGFSGSGLIPIGGIPLFPIWPFKLNVTCSMISVNTGGIRENKRRDLLLIINYCKTLDLYFFILQETHINFSHLHDIRELWDGEVARKDTNLRCFSTSKENSPSYRTNNNWPCWKICFLQNQKYNRCCLSLICALWNNEAAAHRQTCL